MRLAALALAVASCLPSAAPAADWENLLRNGLDDWEVIGKGLWELRSDGVITAHQPADSDQLFDSGDTVTKKQFNDWRLQQSWLYTKKSYGVFDLHLEYWVPSPGNSGVSIRDETRAAAAITRPPDFSKTPSKVGYEIQINSNWPDKWPTGSIYGLAAGREGLQREGEWNSMNIESRPEGIKVYINDQLAAEHPGDPNRPLQGPIGLQLHDQHSVAMFRNIYIYEY